jgi:hypothetical protein
MVRLAVTGWLVVATLLGPWLCCCAAAAPARAAADRTTVPAAVAPKPSCCSHKKKAAEPQDNTPRPDHPHHDCPCKAGVAKLSVAPAPAEVEFLAPAALLPIGSLVESVTTLPHADRGEGRSLSADVLLHVFHNLRC